MSVRQRALKNGTPYWQVRFRENGTESSVSWDNPVDAEKFDKLVKQLGAAKAREICNIVASDRGLTVAVWCHEHLDHLTGVQPHTVKTYRAYLRNDIEPAPLGATPLAVLTSTDIAQWVNGLKGSGKTIANKHGYLAGALNAAVKAGRLKANPCDNSRLPRWHREEMVFLTRDEFATLLSAVPEYWKPLVRFLVASGCRWSEATALTPADVDRRAGTVRIYKAWKKVDGGYEIGVTKTQKSVRTVNVGAKVLAALDFEGEWLFSNSGRGKGRFADGVVRRDDGPVRIHSFNPNVWAPAVARAMDGRVTDPPLEKKPRIHDLRHTCASWLIQAGRPLPAVQAQLGHESYNTTVQVYGHLDRSTQKDNADVIDGMLD